MARTETSPKAALVTLGCPMNQVDSENIMGGLVSYGFEIVSEEEADIVIVNTCGFIEDAKEESIDTILSIADLKEHGNLKSLVVAGCLAERYRTELERDLTEADAIVGLDGRDNIPSLCLKLLNRKEQARSVYSRVVTGPPHSAYLRISEGCDNHCTFCTIPKIRGRFRSVPEEKVLSDAQELVSLGARELILIGQDTTGYGSDLDGKTLPGLLRRLSEIDGVAWLRLMYTHPAHFTDELIEVINGLDKVVPYIDMPIQHISGAVLKRMGRNTSPDNIRSLIDKIRKRIENVVLRTALIVGFPGESERDFTELVEFVKNVRFERLGAFIYSPEEGTRAVKLDGRVSDDVAQERFELLMETQSDIIHRFHQSLVGREFDMIADEYDSEINTIWGRTYMDAPDIDCAVSMKNDESPDKAFCRIKITRAETYDLVGEEV
ncbi:MAG: 30S ribosomal protein S12 methylthiotransferase RimO [Candidatus Latescibacteria bacterium]|nr:30S ribosomal protein S12 methylthiotransferase RimO [Candidatus Latescibacterota bacterium]